MPKFFVNTEQINNDTITILGEDVNHLVNVLRIKKNDTIHIGNRQTEENYIVEIQKIEQEKVICNILNKIDNVAESNIHVHIFQGIPKGEKMELIIQKATELGVKEITPVEMERCVVKIKETDKEKKEKRWEKIAEVAAKQSGRDSILAIKPITKIKNIYENFDQYDIVLVAYEKEEEHTLKERLKQLKINMRKAGKNNIKIAVVIGPEGGIGEEEINGLKGRGAKIVTLGKRILRTETVTLAMSSIILYELE